MKLSVSLSETDVATLDRYVADQGLESRSAGLQQAIRLLPGQDLSEAYAASWDEWESSGEAAAWEATVDDGLRRSEEGPIRPVPEGSSDAAR